MREVARPPEVVTRAAGRVIFTAEVLAELRRSVVDDELGAVVRVRLGDGTQAICLGPDLPQRQVGSVLCIAGYWDAHPHRGEVFRVEELRGLERPREIHAVTLYLVANIPGLGRKRAARLVRVLGAGALERLIETPDLARAVLPGGTGVQVALALSSWAAEQKRDSAARVLATRLTAAGVTYGTVRRIVRFFSTAEAAAVAALRHPYRLVQVPRIGWETADRIALSLGVAEDDPARYLAACEVTLSDAPRSGHTALPSDVLATRAAKLVHLPAPHPDIAAAARRLVSDGHAVDVAGLVGLPEQIALEAELADLIAGILVSIRALSDDESRLVESTLSASGFAAEQQNAVRAALHEGLSVITGRPGAGKTTTLKALVACACALGWRVQIVAPTGKAASRAAAVTGVSASTVHRLLSGEPMDAPAPLTVDLIIVDEASMCDVETAAWLMRAVDARRGTRVVWCGDADQLPSVGSGQVLADIIASGVIGTSRLTRVYRQANGSPIIQNAHRLLDGHGLNLTPHPGWRFVRAAGPLAAADAHVLDEAQRLLSEGRTTDQIQVLAPMRRGVLGVENLNAQLQGLLNPNGATGPHVGGGVRVRAGDRVVITRNIYELAVPVYNGEQGTVVETDRRGHLRVDLGDRVVALAGVHCLMTRLA